MSNSKTVCLFHKDCIDGTAAAAVVLKKFSAVTFFAMGHDYTEDSLAALTRDLENASQLIIVDGCWGIDWFLNKFPELPITLIDHHLSNLERLNTLNTTHSNLKIVFDLNHCATTLAWEYFFSPATPPDLLQYIEDGDLWLKKFEAETPHLTAILSIYRNQPDTYLKLFAENIGELKNRGSYITEYIESSIEKYLKTPPVKIKINNHLVLAFNITDHQSVCGNYLALKHNHAVALFTIKGEMVRFNFRSADSHSPSALDLAIALSGGGHRNSSGGQMTLDEFVKSLISYSE
jgi:uncharacterized protein